MAESKESRKRRRQAHKTPQVAPHQKAKPRGGPIGPAKRGVTRSPRKQRKRARQAAHHRKGRLLRVHLSDKYLEDPKVEYPRSLPVREGDSVTVLRGDFKGHEGKVTEVDRRRLRVFVEGVTVDQADGTEVGRPVHPSNLVITKLDMTDPWRRKLIERGGEA